MRALTIRFERSQVIFEPFFQGNSHPHSGSNKRPTGHPAGRFRLPKRRVEDPVETGRLRACRIGGRRVNISGSMGVFSYRAMWSRP